MALLGIDFGTSNSAAAVLLSGIAEPQMVEPDEPPPSGSGDQVFPSYLYYDRSGEVEAIGTPARDKFFNQGRHSQVVRHFKRLLGRTYDQVVGQIARGHRSYIEYEGRIAKNDDGLIQIKVGDIFIPIRQVAADYIEFIAETATRQSRGEAIESAVICMPAGYGDFQRRETLLAAQLAGLDNVEVLEEPSAALIEKGLEGIDGSVLVIDVGAGTTDVILGNVVKKDGNLRLVTLRRACEDLLGGVDMDNLILEHLTNGELKDIYSELDEFERRRLLGKIEEVKIASSLEGSTNSISLRFAIKDKPSYLFNYPLTYDQLNEIVAPVIWGYRTDTGHIKGIKQTIEQVLLESTGNNESGVAEVVKSIDHLVVVGGPCRMKAIHDMLKEIFADNPNLIKQIDELDPQSRFFMEGVASGAVKSLNGNTKITTSMPFSFGIYSHRFGTVTGIAKGTPYNRETGLCKPVKIPAIEGPNNYYLICQKASSPRDWDASELFVNAAWDGDLMFNLVWDESGSLETHETKTTVKGCGLSEEIHLPWTNINFGNEIKQVFMQRFGLINHVDEMRSEFYPAVKEMLSDTLTEHESGIAAQKHLYLSPDDIEECKDLDVAECSRLDEQQIQQVVKEGFFSASDSIIAEKSSAVAAADELVSKMFSLIHQMRPNSTVDDLIEMSRVLISRGGGDENVYYRQLKSAFTLLEARPDNHEYATTTATALTAYAKHLLTQRELDEGELADIEALCWTFKRSY